MNNPVYQTIIVGGGFTGLFTALHLAHQHYPRTVILIDQHDRFCFKPLLYEYFSGEMDAFQVVPRFTELLAGSGVIFVQDTVQSIDLHQREVKLASGNSYNYSDLVLGLGNVTSFFNIEGAKEYALPFWTQEDVIAIDRRLHNCLRQAAQIQDPEQRRRLLTIAIVGGGASGVEMAATLADLLPNWYAALNGDPQDVRIVVLNRSPEILHGDVNSHLRTAAEKELQKRSVPVEMLMGAEVTAIRPDAVEYKRNGQTETLPAGVAIWTTGSATNPVIKNLAVSNDHRDKHGRLLVTKTLQLPEFPEVFAGGDCAAVENSDSPAIAQVAYQQGAAIAHNLKAMALGHELKPARVNLRGTLLKLGLNDAAANIYDTFEVVGEPAHLIRQGTYLELLPTPVHNFKATTEWLKDEIFNHHLYSGDTAKTVVRTAEVVGGAVVGVLVARKLIQMLGEDHKKSQ